MKYETVFSHYRFYQRWAMNTPNAQIEVLQYICKKITYYHNKLREMERAIGQFHRPVGNYKIIA